MLLRLPFDSLAVLLHDMRQLVRKELLAARTAGIEGPFAKENILSCGERLGAQRPVQRIGAGVSVYTRPRENSRTKRLLHRAAHLAVQRLAAAPRLADAGVRLPVNRSPFTTHGQVGIGRGLHGFFLSLLRFYQRSAG